MEILAISTKPYTILDDATKVIYNNPYPNNFPNDYNRANVDLRVLLRTDSILHKQWGKDTRQALVQGLEICSVVANETAQNILKIFENKPNSNYGCLDVFDTLEELEANVKNPEVADCYFVRKGKNGFPCVYMWNGEKWQYCYDLETTISETGYIYSEADLIKYKDEKNLILMRDITLTKPFWFSGLQDKMLNLNCHKITLSDSYYVNTTEFLGAVFYMGFDVFPETYQQSTKTRKFVINGTIDINFKDVYTFNVQSCSNLNVSGLTILNAHKGLKYVTYYIDPKNTDPTSNKLNAGYHCNFYDIKIEQDTDFFDPDECGVDMFFNDSMYENISPKCYFKAFKSTGANNYTRGLHPFGFVAKYGADGIATNKGEIMGVGICLDGNPMKFMEDIIIDTCEALDKNKTASAENGGIDFECRGYCVSVLNFRSMIHYKSEYKKHIAIYFSDRGADGYNYSGTTTFVNPQILLNKTGYDVNTYIDKPYEIEKKEISVNGKMAVYPRVRPAFFGANFNAEYVFRNWNEASTSLTTSCLTLDGLNPTDEKFWLYFGEGSMLPNQVKIVPFHHTVMFIVCDELGAKHYAYAPKNVNDAYTLENLKKFRDSLLEIIDNLKVTSLFGNKILCTLQGATRDHFVVFSVAKREFEYITSQKLVDYSAQFGADGDDWGSDQILEYTRQQFEDFDRWIKQIKSDNNLI